MFQPLLTHPQNRVWGGGCTLRVTYLGDAGLVAAEQEAPRPHVRHKAVLLLVRLEVEDLQTRRSRYTTEPLCNVNYSPDD
jgi:hypothetical protein